MNGVIFAPTPGGGTEEQGAMHHLFIVQPGRPPLEKLKNWGLETEGFQGSGSFITIPIVLRLGVPADICTVSAG